MTALTSIETHSATQVRPYPDSFGIGQAGVAMIVLCAAERDMLKAADVLLSNRYEPDAVVAMQARIFARNRAEADRARAILEGRA